MATIRKQSIYNTLGYYGGMIIGLVNKMILFPYAFYEAKGYWGLMEFYVSIATVVAAIGGLGMPVVFQRYLPGIKNDLRGKILGTSTIVFLLGAAITLLTGYFFADSISGVSEQPVFFRAHYGLFMIVLVAMLMFELANGLMIAVGKSHVPVIYNNVVLRIFILVLLVLKLTTDLTILQFIQGMAGSYALSSGILLLTALRDEPLRLRWHTWTGRKELFRFGGFSMANRGTVFVLNYIDVLFAGIYLPMASLPVLAMAKYFNSVLLVPGRSVARGTSELVARAWNENDMGLLQHLYRRTSQTGYFLGLLFFAAAWMCMDLFIAILPANEFDMIKPLFAITSVGVLFNLASGVNGQLINLSTFYSLSMYSNLLVAAFSIVAGIVLLPAYGLIGAALAFSTTTIFNNAVKLWIVWYKTKMSPFTDKMLGLTGAYSLPVILSLFVPMLGYGLLLVFLLWAGVSWWVIFRLDVLPELKGAIARRLGVRRNTDQSGDY